MLPCASGACCFRDLIYLFRHLLYGARFMAVARLARFRNSFFKSVLGVCGHWPFKEFRAK